MANILLVAKSVQPGDGGVARSVLGLSKHLTATRFNVSISTGENFKLLESEVDNAELVHCNGVWTPSIHSAIKFARKKSIPVIISPRGMLEPWSLQAKRIKKKLAWMLYQKKDLEHAAVIHATAEQEKDNLKALDIRTRIQVIANGVDIVDEDEVKSFQERENIVLFLSRLHKKKGIENLLKAWSEVLSDKWKLRIVGGGDEQYVADLKAMAGSLCEKDAVDFYGVADDVTKWSLYSESKVFVLPTMSENFGLVIAEALGSGTPVITTKETPWQELESRRCGWWIDLSYQQLVDALREAMNTKDSLLQEMGEAGRRLVEEKYTWNTVIDQYANLYDSVLSGSR